MILPFVHVSGLSCTHTFKVSKAKVGDSQCDFLLPI